MKKILLFCVVAFVHLLIINTANAQFANYVQMPENRNVFLTQQPDLGRTIAFAKVTSPGLEGNILGDSPERSVSVYLPPGYEKVKDRYPVIYLLGEFSSDHAFWFGGHDALMYNLTGVLDYLINKGKINPVIVVSPSNHNKYKGSWFTNSALAGDWENFNAEELVTYIDNNFRTISRPESRGIAGWSMGGYGAVTLAMKHPDIFSSVYSISGALLDFQHRLINYGPERNDLITAAKVTRDKFSLSSNQLYCFSLALAFAPNINAVGYGDLPFGPDGEFREEIWQKWMEHNPITQIPTYRDNLDKLRAIALECGTGEPPVYNENVSFSNALKDNGIEHVLNIHGGDHQYSIFNRMDTHVFPFFSTNLEKHFITTDKILLCETDTLKIKMFNTTGTLYIVPLNTSENLEEIVGASLYTKSTVANETVTVFTKDLATGYYLAIGVTDAGFITVPERFTVKNDVPVMTVRVTELYSGDPLSDCKVYINTQEFTTNHNGEINLEGCGKRLIQVFDPGYMHCGVTVMVYSDTLVQLEAVRKSFVKVVDKATGEPVYWALLRSSNGNSGTDKNGIAVIRVLPVDDKLSFHITHENYFDLVCEVEPIYAETVTVALTRKIARVCFLVEDESGPLPGQKVDFIPAYLYTDDSGSANFSGRPARAEYTFTVKRNGFIPVQKTFFLERDTLIKVKLIEETLLTGNESAEPATGQHSGAGDAILTGMNTGMIYGLRVFPNPVKDIINISFTSGSAFTVKIINVNGETIQERLMEQDQIQIDMSPFMPGMYMVLIRSGNQVITKKVIKL
jgi:S-formylglutathione hydrolase